MLADIAPVHCESLQLTCRLCSGEVHATTQRQTFGKHGLHTDISLLCAAPNPTHQLHLLLHWLWMYVSRILRLGPREVALWADCDPDACSRPGAEPECSPPSCMGPYGQGLAEALFSKPSWWVCLATLSCHVVWGMLCGHILLCSG